jgi:CheY-like chemotaxis protein
MEQLIETSARAERPGGNILVVDDHPEITDLLSEALTEEGYQVRVAHDGASALRAIKREPPDLLLVDIAMPVMRGDELLSQLRSDGFVELPVIVMTADTRPERFRPMGANQLLRKPFDLERLIATVEAYVRA